MKNAFKIIGLLILIGALGYLDRGFVDYLGLGVMALLVAPVVIAYGKVGEGK